MKKSKILNIMLTSVMLLSTIFTPQMSYALASMQADEAEDSTEVEQTDTDAISEEPVGEADEGAGDGDGEEVTSLDGQTDTGEPEDETQPDEDDEVVSEEPEVEKANSPPVVSPAALNARPTTLLEQNLITEFELTINPGPNQEVIHDGDNKDVDLDEMNALRLIYTLVKPDEVVVNPGDTFTIDLPDIYEGNISESQNITIGEVIVGTFIIQNNQVVITFNAEIEEFDDTEMFVNITGEFNTEVFEEEQEVVVNVPFREGNSYTATIRAEKKNMMEQIKK